MPGRTITILSIRNVGNQPLQVSVGPIDENEIFGTDCTEYTPFDGDFGFFAGAGLAKILPNRVFEIEEYRVNLGQIQNYVDNGQAKVERLERLVSALEEETG